MGGKILFLGTGGDAIVVGKQFRHSGGIILEAENNLFLIDPGPGALVMANLYGINLRKTTALFVTHNHINHAGGANAVISAMTLNGLDRKGVLVSNKTAVNGIDDVAPLISPFFKQCVERFIALGPNSKVGVNAIDIHLTPAFHDDPHTVGLKFKTQKFVLGYTSDTEYRAEVALAFENSDILIINVMVPEGVMHKHHMHTGDAIKLVEKTRPRLVVITHFGIKMLQADPLYEARKIQRNTGIQTIAAKDGMMIDPYSFSSSVSQKTLQSF